MASTTAVKRCENAPNPEALKLEMQNHSYFNLKKSYWTQKLDEL